MPQSGPPSALPQAALRLVGLVADDLTGATDSAVQFAEAGWRAQLLRHPTIVPEGLGGDRPTLLAISTGARHDGDAQAAALTATAVRRLQDLGVERLFVKVDSTTRGSIAGQVAGALTAWTSCDAHPVAVICPAFPELGRTVVEGRVLVNGEPVELTAAAADPVAPVTNGRLAERIPGSVRTRSDELAAAHGDRLICDALTTADLGALAVGLVTMGRRAIAVGSAGLAAAVAGEWLGEGAPPAPLRTARTAATQVLVAVSSAHPVSRVQTARLQEAWGSDRGVRVLTTPDDRSERLTHADIAGRLGDLVVTELRRGGYEALVVVGGDGAAAILDRLGVEQVVLSSALAVGTPDGTLLGGMADGMRLVTKSGGFGDPDTLVTLVARLREPTVPAPRTGLLPSTADPSDKEAP